MALAQSCSNASPGLQERAAGALWGLSVSEVNRYVFDFFSFFLWPQHAKSKKVVDSIVYEFRLLESLRQLLCCLICPKLLVTERT